MHALTVSAQDRRPRRPAAGGQNDPIGGHDGSVAQLDPPYIGSQPGDSGLGDQADMVIPVPLRPLQCDVVELGMAGEIVLRQRRTVIRDVARVEKRQLAVEATGPQRGDRAYSGDASADHDHSGHRYGPRLGNRYTSPSRISTRCATVSRVAGSPSTAPVFRQNLLACSGHSTWPSSTQPSAREASACVQVSFNAHTQPSSSRSSAMSSSVPATARSMAMPSPSGMSAREATRMPLLMPVSVRAMPV